MSNQILVLQSGFLAYQTRLELIKGVSPKDPFRDFVLDADHLKSENQAYYSTDIDNLYEQALKNRDVYKLMDFREKIIITAFRAFGCHTFKSWLDTQSRSRYIGDLHLQFLTETMQYCVDKNKRITNINTWWSILSILPQSTKVTVNIENFIKNRYPKLYNDNRSRSTQDWEMDRVISNWTQDEDGVTDLLVTLKVIFGSRNVVENLANKNYGT